MSGETSSREVAGRVQFALKDAIPGNHGIPLSLLLNGRAETFAPYIKDADARVLTELVSEGIFAVPLEVRWPAYPGFLFRHMIQIANVETKEPYTRLQVGHILANVLAMFVKEARCERVSTDPWDAAYHFGPGGLAFEGLWLVSLWHVGSNTFEAELRYSEPPCN